MKRKIRIVILALVVIGGVIGFIVSNRAHDIVVTGIVTTDSVIVGSEITGRLQELRVKEGDTVKSNDLLAVIRPEEWQADVNFYTKSQDQSAAQVTQAAANLKFEEAQTTNQIKEAEANLASAQAQVTQAQADLENTRLTSERTIVLSKQDVESKQEADQARTSLDSAVARVDSLKKQVEAADAALALAHANADQVTARRAELEAMNEQREAMGAQKDKAEVLLDRTKLRAPIDGIVDVRAALQGEVVSPGQAIVTLVNPDDYWVRADIEETYLDRVQLGDKLKVKLPSGEVREGTVFFRGVDADFATQRDVSRSKRDIKTFELRLRCDNRDRLLALGMTAYVTLPATKTARPAATTATQ
jgi:multidrug resistance efflux pump